VPACADLFVPFCPDDAGNCIGAALYVAGKAGMEMRRESFSPFVGPDMSGETIEEALARAGINAVEVADPALTGAAMLAEGKIVGWFQGRMEFGPRSLGNRSILADVRDADNRRRLNRAVKFRESFRPFAASVLAEKAHLYFDLDRFLDGGVPYMEKVVRAREEMRRNGPAAVHADGSCRIQTLPRASTCLFRRLIEEVERLTGMPMVVNTSFNLNGEPIVCTPMDAIRTFYTSGLDVLILGPYLVVKE